jgi:hypothetical protein
MHEKHVRQLPFDKLQLNCHGFWGKSTEVLEHCRAARLVAPEDDYAPASQLGKLTRNCGPDTKRPANNDSALVLPNEGDFLQRSCSDGGHLRGRMMKSLEASLILIQNRTERN